MAVLLTAALKFPARAPKCGARREEPRSVGPAAALSRLLQDSRRMNSLPVDAVDDAPLDHAAVRTIVLGILLAMFLGALDQTIVATALPTIGRELGDVENLSWVVSAYLLTSTAVTPLYGKLSDIHGRRAMLLVAILVFSLGSVASALAPSMMVLIVARALQGLG